MAILILLIIATALIVLSFFAVPRLSPIPYFPSNASDLPLIIQALGIGDNQTIYDLGAGDGTVIFKAAQEAYQKQSKTTFVAVEINPVLVALLHIRRLFHPFKKNIHIIWDDLFTLQYKEPTRKLQTFYLYLSPWFLEKIYMKIRKEHRHSIVISYMYPVPARKPYKILQGKNRIFIYNKTVL